MNPARLDLRCACTGCKAQGAGEKLGELKDGQLLIKARRHGREHVVRISVDELHQYLQKSFQSSPGT